MTAPVRWHRGLPYRADRPLDRGEGRGWLAREVHLAGVVLPAGTEVWRDIDSDAVWARLDVPARLGALDLPAGTVVELDEAPRSIGGVLHRVLWVLPIVTVWTVVVGAAELLQGRWPPAERPARRARLAFVAWPVGEVFLDGVPLERGPDDRLLYRRDGTVEVVPEGPS